MKVPIILVSLGRDIRLSPPNNTFISLILSC
nr:MAG TPA: hypothetical protein [Caudoviricetes sp.]DAK46210.1 MAG TPA: hypothetical protein [Caudoviricetes sp.]DAO61743.1 MAG TPA: hypothetical protein [Bacteriophage sp.]DAT20585.1 MAG TPA: hypothetical protein [Caudoviricetes sp.]DAW48100.1 MAG TPA: hypothetical protein [Caudoviricetes sp.]